LTRTRQVALAEWSNMDNAQLRELLEKGQILFQEEFAKVQSKHRVTSVARGRLTCCRWLTTDAAGPPWTRRL
jgi:hypothetical protein